MEQKIYTAVLKQLQKNGNLKAKVAKTVQLLSPTSDPNSPGFVSSLVSIANQSDPRLCGVTVLEQCLVHSWLTFCTTDLFHCATNQEFDRCLHYVNKELLWCSYLCGDQLTIADIVFFFSLEPFIAEWNFERKEQFVNISRWFDNLQLQSSLSGSRRKIIFAKSLLYD